MKNISLSGKAGKGKFTLVDSENFDELNKWTWGLSTMGYVRRNHFLCRVNGKVKCKTIYMHREVMNTPEDLHTDHINHDLLNNQKSNLRICNYQQNNFNRIKSGGCSSKYKGVFFIKDKDRWASHIKIRGESIWLGYFDNEVEAAKIYDKKAEELFGEFAYLNFPEIDQNKGYPWGVS